MEGVAPPGLGDRAMIIEQMFQQIMAQGDEIKRSVAKLTLRSKTESNR